MLPACHPNPGRQGSSRAVDPRPYGAAPTLPAGRCRLVAAFRSELLTFPAGKFDDQVDALGLIGQLLDKMLVGQKPTEQYGPL